MQNKVLIILIVILLIIIGIVATQNSKMDDASDEELTGEEMQSDDAMVEGDDSQASADAAGAVAGVNINTSLAGVWKNTALPRYILELSADGVAREYYAKALTNTGSWTASDESLNVVFTGRNYSYKLITVNSDSFVVEYIATGERLQFSKANY